MKFILTAQDFKRALNTCNEIAPVSSAIAEEKTGILIQTREDSVIFMSSDDTSSISVTVPAKIQKSGKALVRCISVTTSVIASFMDLCFDNNHVEIKVETTSKQTLKVSGDNRPHERKKQPVNRTFPLLNTDFFRETAEFEDSKSTQFPAFQFMDGLAKVGHAASKDVSKLHFNCINLKLVDDEVIFAATDGIQIAEFRKAAEINNLRGSFILGLKFASVAAKLVNPGKFEFVDIYIHDNNFFLKSGGTVLIGTLLNTDFPKYDPYMDISGLQKATFPREDFLVFLQGMQPSVDAKSHRMVIEANTKGTALLSTSSISGEADSGGLDVDTPEDFTLHFDSTLLQNAVRQMKGDEFDLYFTQDAKGVVLKSQKNNNFTAFVCTLKKID